MFLETDQGNLRVLVIQNVRIQWRDRTYKHSLQSVLYLKIFGKVTTLRSPGGYQREPFQYPIFCCLVVKLCLTLCDPMDCSMPGFPVLYLLLEFVQIHMKQVGDATHAPNTKNSYKYTRMKVTASFQGWALFRSNELQVNSYQQQHNLINY